MERSLKCPTCGTEVGGDAHFCNACGMHLEGPTEPEHRAVQRTVAPTVSRNPIERRQTRKVPAVKRRRS